MKKKSLKVADLVAEYLESKTIKHVFGIVGAGNAHLFDAIMRRGYTQIICVHHEQAATMAMQTYYRTNGIVCAALVTTGGGSTNAVTGVVSAWMDSIPGLVIAGNENSKYTDPDNPLRIWGVQGYDSVAMVAKVTKYAKRVMEPEKILEELDHAYDLATSGKPGPSWLEIPMNVQAAPVNRKDCSVYEKLFTKFPLPQPPLYTRETGIGPVLAALKKAQRPVLWLGHGVRLAKAESWVEPLLEQLHIPTLVSWAGIDLIDSDHPLVFGRAGVYGQRAANFVLQNADFILTIGTRLAIPQVGYDLKEFAREAKIACVDIDLEEVTKLGERITWPILADAGEFIRGLIQALDERGYTAPANSPWVQLCRQYRDNYPVVGPEHQDRDGFINSYPFMAKLGEHLKPDQVIVTDMGTALLSGHQVLSLRAGQRLMTTTGLGEMGYGLPGAIGASFARDKSEVLCLNCDGGMMLNLQELQTIVHHQLPIKIVVFNNDGYLMIKHTQKALFAGRYSGTDKKSGVSCPDFSAVAKAFGIQSFKIKTWKDFAKVIPKMQAFEGPVLCEVFTHPEQLFVPKLSLAVQADGSLVSPPLEDLSPLLSRKELEENMVIGLHPKSVALKV
jgi:acetolactate synthase-1/2/3 large subunit